MRAITTIILFLALQIGLIAQTEQRERVDVYVMSVDSILETCQEVPTYCGYYLNELHINKNGEQWRAVGQYHKTVKFWYTDDPGQIDEEEGKPVSVLKVVEVTVESTYYDVEYFFFDNGELVYYSKHFEASDGSEDTEVYFDGGRDVYLQHEKSDGSDNISPDFAKNCLKEGLGYQKLFLTCF